MKYRPSPDFVAVIIIIAALFLTCAYLLGAIMFWQSAQAHGGTEVRYSDHRPDISHCFKPDETRELWDCIRHVEE